MMMLESRALNEKSSWQDDDIQCFALSSGKDRAKENMKKMRAASKSESDEDEDLSESKDKKQKDAIMQPPIVA